MFQTSMRCILLSFLDNAFNQIFKTNHLKDLLLLKRKASDRLKIKTNET